MNKRQAKKIDEKILKHWTYRETRMFYRKCHLIDVFLIRKESGEFRKNRRTRQWLKADKMMRRKHVDQKL